MDYKSTPYRGFYSHRMIRKAQDTLEYSIYNSNNRFVRQVLFKCGAQPNSYGFYARVPIPHNNLWHEDALKYKYTFPWSEGYNMGHDNKNSYRSRNSTCTSRQSDERVMPHDPTTPILYDQLWHEDALGSTQSGYCDFTNSAPSGRSASDKNCRTAKVSEDDAKLSMTVNCDSSDKEPKDRKNVDDSSCEYIMVSDTEQHVDLTNDSDESAVSSTARKMENKKSVRKRPNNESAEMYTLDTDGSGPSVSKKQCVEYSQGLVCDYCGYVVAHKLHHHNHEADEVMKCHFSDRKHNSASLAKIQLSNENTGKAIAILKESVLITATDRHVALVNQVVPMCPWKGCNIVYGTIWACAKHYEMCHNRQISNCYGLASVVGIKTLLFPAGNTCKACNTSFDSASALHKHWKKTQHLNGFFSTKEQLALYFCPYCNQLHYNFSACRAHIILKHRAHGDASMQVVFLDRSTDQLELLPIEPRPAEAQAHCEMTVLDTMNKCAKVYGITKISQKKIKKERRKCKRMSEQKKC